MPIVTRTDVVVRTFDHALEALHRLRFGGYERLDVAKTLEPLGSQLELFLRAAVFPSSTRNDRLVDLIQDLASQALPQSDIAALDKFRLLYNGSKHEPTEELRLIDVIPIVAAAIVALRAIGQLAIGLSSSPEDRSIRYQLQVAAWDHVIGGETEINVSIPSDHWTGAGTLDVFHIDWKNWESLKTALESDDRFHFGEAYFAPDVWKFMCSEGDFLNAGVWEGSYRELSKLLASVHSHHHNAELLPILRRESSLFSVSTSLTMAAIDLVTSLDPDASVEEFTQSILERAKAEYAISDDSNNLKSSARQLATLLLQHPPTGRRHLIGPIIRPSRGGTQNYIGPLPAFFEGRELILEY